MVVFFDPHYYTCCCAFESIIIMSNVGVVASTSVANAGAHQRRRVFSSRYISSSSSESSESSKRRQSRLVRENHHHHHHRRGSMSSLKVPSATTTAHERARREETTDDEEPSTSYVKSSSSTTNNNASSSSSSSSRRVVLGATVSMATFAMMMMESGAKTEGTAFAEEGEAAETDEEEAPTEPMAEEKREIPLKKVARDSLAFTFAYPMETLSGKPIPWSESRVRDTYSSSEPMSPDARQRIVHELISVKGPLTAVVTVGELPPRLLNKSEKEWTAKNVANAILADKATGRVASGQKISLAEVDNAVKEEKEDGTTYYYYEYISQGSPNSKEGEATTYRHARGVTAVRDGFAYTVSMSTPERFWEEMDEGFNQSIRAFSLDQPGKKYRKPGDEGLGIFHVFD